ncbi:MAG: MBL fold metallo-hydrolase, partial [Clostridia bacterium]|nr:MBL fold metallo-hydrolase [Clostridia bacterium]
MFSGSSGNCTYISSGDFSILIDAGVSAKAISNALADINVSPDEIDAIFITHEHCDHIKG